MQVLSGALSSIIFLAAIAALVLASRLIGIIIGVVAIIAIITFIILTGTTLAILGGGFGILIVLGLIIYAIFKKPTNQSSTIDRP